MIVLEQERPVPEPIHNRMQDLLLQYIVVGEMPEVVQTFVDTRQMNKVLQSDNYRTSFGWECNPGDIQGIYAGYRPVYKYAGGRDSGRCTAGESLCIQRRDL